jgi:2-phosphosulfolactate phosphatase
MYFDQIESDIRFEWGLSGLEALAPGSDVVVIIDVLSFTTSVDIVTARGGFVLPYAGPPEALAAFAQAANAAAAGHRKQGEGGFSLSPASLVNIPPGTRLILPSPNGSTLSFAVRGIPALAGCLRNAAAAARKASQLGKRISVIAAGERWRDGLLRPALEDLLGAGAVIASLPGRRSPEASMAATAFEHAREDLPNLLMRCGSGKELVGKGFAEDVYLASQYNTSSCAPLLVDGAYTNLPNPSIPG